MEDDNIFPSEQKGSRKESYGCKDHLLVNKMILENARTKQTHLSNAWIDYKKAFDSVPHSWILRYLETVKVSPIIINFLRTSINRWETNLTLTHSNGILTANGMCINCGLFQGDSLPSFVLHGTYTPVSTFK